jgi:hypothetical protein
MRVSQCASGTEHPAPSIRHRASGIVHPELCIRHCGFVVPAVSVIPMRVMTSPLLLRAVVALVVVNIASGCGQKEPEPEPEPEPVSERMAPQPYIDYGSVLGVARARSSGVICVAMPAALELGHRLTLVTVPVAVAQAGIDPPGYSSVLAARVAGSGKSECSVAATGYGFSLPGDSLYTVSVVRDSARTGPVYFAVDLPYENFFRVGHVATVRLSEQSEMINFRICAGGEGLHLTLWDGKPITGKRLWHRYFHLGRDTEPSCGEADTG